MERVTFRKCQVHSRQTSTVGKTIIMGLDQAAVEEPAYPDVSTYLDTSPQGVTCSAECMWPGTRCNHKYFIVLISQG